MALMGDCVSSMDVKHVIINQKQMFRFGGKASQQIRNVEKMKQ
jgi:hypothetical protein